MVKIKASKNIVKLLSQRPSNNLKKNSLFNLRRLFTGLACLTSSHLVLTKDSLVRSQFYA